MPDIPSAKLISERFEVGRHFCNKLWNAVRFALLNLERASFVERNPATLPFEERWILSRLTRATRRSASNSLQPIIRRPPCRWRGTFSGRSCAIGIWK